MEKCQYILERNLPSLASADELQRIEAACSQRSNVVFKGTAHDWLEKNSTPEFALRGAIIRHIRAGKKVFHKFKFASKTELIDDDVQANVTISDGIDIYVEIWIESEDLITVYAHDHNPGPRLPQ